MNRATKYRAYVRSEDKVYDVQMIRFNGEGVREICIVGNILPAHIKRVGGKPAYGVKTNRVQLGNFDLMEYTGVGDSKGNEIYEGDILHCLAEDDYKDDPDAHDIKTTVRWDFKEAAFQAAGYLPLTWGGWEHIEVIGNIYTDKELLK